MADDYFKFNDATLRSRTNLTLGQDTAQQAISDRKLAKTVGVTPLEVPYFRDELVQQSLNQDAERFGGLPGFKAFTSDPLYGPLVAREPKDWEEMNVFEKAVSVWEQGRDERHEADLMQGLVNGQEDIDRAVSDGARERARAEQEKRLMEWQDAMKRKRAIAQPKALERLSKADTFSDVMDAFLEQPLDIAYYTAGKSMASQAELMAAQVVAGLTGFFSGGLGTVLTMGVAGAGSYEIDRRSALLEAMSSQGVDLNDADAVNAFLSNAPRLQQALDQASAHAAPVAAIDALSMGVAGKVAGVLTGARGAIGAGRVIARSGGKSLPFARRAFTKAFAEAERKQGWWLSTLDDTLTGSIAGGALGGLGEYLGQKNAGQKISIGDIFLEAIADFANMPADMMSARAGKALGDFSERARAQKSARQAEASKVALSAMMNAQLHQSAPDAFGEFAKQVGEMSGEPNLYIKADVIRANAELANGLASISPAMAQAVQEAREMGTTVAVPLQLYAAEIGQNQQLAELVRQNASRTPDLMSPAEVDAWKANQKNQQFAKENQREIVEQIKASKEFQQELDEALAPIEQALMRERSEEMTPDVVHTQMKSVRAVLGNLAVLSGMTPTELVKRNPLQVQRIAQSLAANSQTNAEANEFQQVHSALPGKENKHKRKFANYKEFQESPDAFARQIGMLLKEATWLAPFTHGLTQRDFALYEMYTLKSARRALEQEAESAKNKTERTKAEKKIATLNKKIKELASGGEVEETALDNQPWEKTVADMEELFGRVIDATEDIIDFMERNLLYYANLAPEDVKAMTIEWYVGAKRVSVKLAERYGISPDQTASILAVFSPQTDWNLNVSLAERTLDILFSEARNTKPNEAMAKRIRELVKEGVGFKEEDADLIINTPLPELIERAEKIGKQKGATDPMDLASLWIRAYDETFNDPRYRYILPNGSTGEVVMTEKGAPKNRGWGAYARTSKAIRLSRDESPDVESTELGDNLKVRDFNNNIFDPDDPHSVTIDTHAVAVALSAPLSAKDEIVNQNFGKGARTTESGQKGLYSIIAEAYYRAGKRLELLPREVQSLTWEVIRTVFTAKVKSKGRDQIFAILQRFADGELTEDTFRDEVVKTAAPEGLKFSWDSGVQATSTGEGFTSSYDRSNVPTLIRGDYKPKPQLMAEVAPSPSNAEEVALWNQLTPKSQAEVTRAVLEMVIGEVGEIEDTSIDTPKLQLGGYAGGVNVSTVLNLKENPDNAVRIASIISWLLDQDSVYILSSTEAKGLEHAGSIHLKLPDSFTDEQIDDLYKNTLYSILDKDKEPLLSGFVRQGNVLIFGLKPELDAEVEADKVESALRALVGGSDFDVAAGQVYSADVKPYNFNEETQNGKRDSAQDGATRHAAQRDARYHSTKAKIQQFRAEQINARLAEQRERAQGGAGEVGQADQVNQLNQGARGSFDPATGLIKLFKSADQSTFLHESAHYYLNALTNLVLDAIDRGNMTDGEQELMRTLDGFLRWQLVKGSTPEERVRNFASMSVDQQRDTHEAFARGFEAYLRQGKAPTKGLRNAFKKFKAWLTRLYRTAAELNVELTPEVSALYDRLFVTEAEASYIENDASMRPLFSDEDKDKVGEADLAQIRDDFERAGADVRATVYASRERNFKILTNKHEREKRGIEKDYETIEAQTREEVEAEPTRQAEALLEGRDPKANRQARERTKNILASEARRAKEGDNVEERYQAIRAEVEAERANDTVAKVRQKLASGKKLSPDDVLNAGEAGLSDRAMDALEEQGLVALTDNDGEVISLSDLQKELGVTYKALIDAIETALFSKDEKSTVAEEIARRYIDRYGYLSSEANTVARYKLHRENLEGVGVSEETIQKLDEKGYLMREGETENTMPIELLADMVGAENVLDFAEALANQKPIDEEVTDRAVDAFSRKYGDFPDERGMWSAALNSLVQHTDAFTRAIAGELNAIAKLLKIPAPAREVLTRYAQQKTKATKISDFHPTVHTRAEHKAGKDAQEAWKNGQYEEAFQHKKDQFIQHVLAKEADHALVLIEKRIKMIKRALKSKTIAGDFMEQIENLAARFGFVDFAVDENAPSLESFILAQQEEGYVFDFPQWLLRGGQGAPYQTLTYEQFLELTDALMTLQSAGRNKQTVLMNGVRVRTADAVREARAQIQESAKDMGREAKVYHDSDQKTLAQKFIGFMRNHIKIASWCRIMDGNKDGGIMWTLFTRRANECANKEAEYRKNLTVRMVEILEPVISRFKMNEVVARLPVRQGYRPITRAERLSMALNYGNAGNRQRLIDGFETTDSVIRGILEGMTETEWRCVENIWKTFEMLRPELEALERRIYGRAPEWIQYEPFQMRTAEGKEITVSGGYYPAVYDADASSLSEAYDDTKSAEVMMRAAVQAMRTDRSHMKARAAKVKRPLTLRMSALFDALNDEVHDLTWREFVIDASRLLKSGLGDTIREYYSPDVIRLFNNWLRDVAVGDKRSRIAGEGWSSRLRQGAGVAGLGFNVVSAIAQITGLGISVARLGPAIGTGIGIYLSNPVGATRQANEASLFMRNRSLTRFRELNEANNRLQQRNVALDNFRNAAYWLMLRVQQIVDTITWHAAYAKAIREGFDDKTAIELADQTVIDTQGGGEVKDLSQVERGGEVAKLFTVYYSFMNTALNLNAVAYLGEKNRAKAMAQILIVSTVMPIVESMLRAALPAGGGDDDDDDQRTDGEKAVAMLRSAAGEVVSFNLGTIMVGREVASAAANLVKGEPVWKWTGPSGARLISDAINFGAAASKLELDKAMLKSMVNLGGTLFGLPSAQINRAVEATDAYLEGEIDSPVEGARAALLGINRK